MASYLRFYTLGFEIAAQRCDFAIHPSRSIPCVAHPKGAKGGRSTAEGAGAAAVQATGRGRVYETSPKRHLHRTAFGAVQVSGGDEPLSAVVAT